MVDIRNIHDPSQGKRIGASQVATSNAFDVDSDRLYAFPGCSYYYTVEPVIVIQVNPQGWPRRSG